MKTYHAWSPVWNHLLRRALLMCAGLVLSDPVVARGATFANTTPITIAVGAQPNPYPSNIGVSNITGVITDVSVTLNGLAHSFPDDLDILLVGPGGQNVLLMSDAGGDNALGNPPVRLTFSDTASAVLPDSGRIVTGAYRPSNYEAAVVDQFPFPAPGGPYGNALSVFDGTNPNGQWKLFVADDNSSQGFGSIAGGWELNLTLVFPPLTIVLPPEQNASPGDIVTFQAVVQNGTPPFSYQWWHNGQPIGTTGPGGPTLTLSSVQVADAGFYSVVVANAAAPNGVRSSEAHLNVLGPLTIVQPPASVIVAPGVDVRLCVAASGLPPIRYQWTLNGMVLSNETDACLVLPNVDAKTGGNYQVVVWNDDEAITTQPGLLLVRAPTNPNAPTDSFADRPLLDDFKAVLQGNNAQARTESGEPVLRGGGRSVWLQWTAPDTGIATFGARGSSFDTLLAVYTGTKLEALNLVAKDDDRGGFYTSSVQFNTQRGVIYQIQLDGFGRNGAGGEFTLCWDLERTEEQVPIIITEPASQGVQPGGTAIFHVEAVPATAQYQWFFNGRPIAGANSDTFVVENAKSAHVGLYSVRVMNQFQRAIFSETANLQLGSFTFPLAQDKLENVYFAMRSGQSGGGGFPGGGGFTAASGGSLGAGYIAIGLGNLVSNEVNSAANHQAGDPNPCGSPLFGTLWQGLAATNTGVILVDTYDSEILARMAVYRFATNTGILSSTNIVCDLSSASNGFPAAATFDAQQGSNYVIVLEGYHATGNLLLNCKMGVAPAVRNPLKSCFVPEGGSITLSMPATNWCPLPSCQWLFKGVDIPGATGPTLLLTAFDAGDVGIYSVRMSNFVRTATQNVAYVGLSGPFLLNHWWVTNSGNVGFAINASNSTPFVLETTTDLSGSWIPIATNPDPCLVLVFTNSGALTDPQRFFRAAPWTPPGP